MWIKLSMGFTAGQGPSCNLRPVGLDFEPVLTHNHFITNKNKAALLSYGFIFISGGRDGIRTHDTLIMYTHFPGVRLQPLGHPSVIIISLP